MNNKKDVENFIYIKAFTNLSIRFHLRVCLRSSEYSGNVRPSAQEPCNEATGEWNVT